MAHIPRLARALIAPGAGAVGTGERREYAGEVILAVHAVGIRPTDPPVRHQGGNGSGPWRLVIGAALLAALLGGVIYAALMYFGSDAGQIADQAIAETPASSPTAVVLPTASALSVAVPGPTSADTPPPPKPSATFAPTPSVASTPTPAGPTEREMVVKAFAECNSMYSGEEKRRRFAAVNSAIDAGLHSVASIRALAEENCGGIFPDPLIVAVQSSGTPPPGATLSPTFAPRPTPTLSPTATPAPTRTPTPVPSPELRHPMEKRYMLELINAERAKAGVGAVVLGDNIAAQTHAESALKNCFSSHWGMDGLKPYMRYSLAGGYQSNGENGSGLDYCIRPSDGYRAIGGIEQEIEEAMDGWMRSPGHRRNLLDPTHQRVNIGIAWDRYNTVMYQHFEGGYVEYERLPTISSGVLSFTGTAKNGVRFSQERDLGVQIYYDPPPHELTAGQLSRTYCYDSGRPVAGLRPPLAGRSFYPSHEFTRSYAPCPNPYDVPSDAPAPRSPAEAHRAWQEAYSASRSPGSLQLTIPWINALQWKATGADFAIRADIDEVLKRHGRGVYSLIVWGKRGGEDIVLSQYSIFHGVVPPDGYTRGK